MNKIIVLSMLVWSASVDALGPSPVVLLDHGVVCDVLITGQQDAPLTESGQLNLVDQDRTIDVTTATVPARLGLSFGIRVTLETGTALADARVVVHHPPLGAARVTTQSWPIWLNAGDVSLNLFTFEHAYELVEGRWMFQIIGAHGIALSQEFDVVDKYAAAAVQDACFPAAVTS